MSPKTAPKTDTPKTDAPKQTADKNSDLRELAAAMNRLADSLNQTNALFAEARKEDPNWKSMPTTFVEMTRQLRMISSRL